MTTAGAVAVSVIMASFLVWLWYYSPPETEDEVSVWLEKQGLSHLRHFSPFREMNRLEELAELNLDTLPDLISSSNQFPVLEDALLLLELQLWLREEELEEVLTQLVDAGYKSKHSLLTLDQITAEKLVERLHPTDARERLKSILLPSTVDQTTSTKHTNVWLSLLFWVIIFILTRYDGLGTIIKYIFPPIVTTLGARHRANRRLNKEDLKATCDHTKCLLEWNHDDNSQVGGASVITLKLVCYNFSPYNLNSSDTLTATIKHTSTRTTIPNIIEPTSPTNHNILRLSFTTRMTGSYSIHIVLNGQSIAGTPVTRTYIPGPVDPSKTSFVNQPQLLIVTAGIYHSMTVVPRDTYGNSATIEQEGLTVNIRKDGPEGVLINPECIVERIPNTAQFELLMKVESPGHYIGCVLYKGQRIGPPEFTVISLSRGDAVAMEKNLEKRNVNLYYEASMMSEDKKHKKKVYCYLYPKQLQVKEFYLKIIPYRLYSCKVCPSTTIRLEAEPGLFTIDDGYQTPVTLSSPHREIISATFYKYLLKNIGGSEQFKDKEKFFFAELRNHHSKQPRTDAHLVIDRFNLLESMMQATKGFSVSDWRKSFTVEFRGEEALDWGGVSRELFQLLTNECFNCNNQMFRRFKDSPQALVHPNSHHPPRITSRHYEFAGRLVGKCLYESCHGNRLLVSARFTRSFLAQIIRLRINYKYFESDDPDLYTSKIQYIRDNDVSDLELVFAEEEVSDKGDIQIIPLVDYGDKMAVTEQNKYQYLNFLAQYRLSKQTKICTEHFMKGLNELVPDNLLGIFDENELELLMCGTETVSFEDFKKHSVVCTSTSPHFQTVVSWFWLVVSGFQQEEMARLLQFVTSSSQLPPGGFKELNPQFKITSAPTHGRLPSAHTCFNQLCLPDYDSCEQLQTALTLALNEGTEGFGLL